jgi:hypothetical protein
VIVSAKSGTIIDATGDGVQVSWDQVPQAVSYTVYWGTTANFTLSDANSQPAGGGSTTLVKLSNPSGYYFTVAAIDSTGKKSSASHALQASAASGNGSQPANASQPTSKSQPTTNVGQATDTNVQTPTLTFAHLTRGTYPVIGVQNGTPTGKLTFTPTALNTMIGAACNITDPKVLADTSTYVVINVINVATAAQAAQQTVSSNNWYVYRQKTSFSSGFAHGWQLVDFDGSTRLYGAKTVYLLSIVENDLAALTDVPAVSYTLTVTKQDATNVSDLFSLMSLVAPGGTNAEGEQSASAIPQDFWACGAVPIAYKTSTIKIDLNYSHGGGSPFTASQTFINEAKEHWDVSFALPIKKVSELQYSTTGNTVTATQVTKTNLYAVFDWYPYAVDLKNTKFNYIPGIFAGVAMNSQPLHSLIFGASVGTKFAQFYAGALLLKQQVQPSNTSPGASATYQFQPQFSVGIKISVTAAAKAIAGSK